MFRSFRCEDDVLFSLRCVRREYDVLIFIFRDAYKILLSEKIFFGFSNVLLCRVRLRYLIWLDEKANEEDNLVVVLFLDQK